MCRHRRRSAVPDVDSAPRAGPSPMRGRSGWVVVREPSAALVRIGADVEARGVPGIEVVVGADDGEDARGARADGGAGAGEVEVIASRVEEERVGADEVGAEG